MSELWCVGRGPVMVRPWCTTGGALKYPEWVAPLPTAGQVVCLANAVGSYVENLRIRPVAVGGGPARQPGAGAVEFVDAKAAAAHAVPLSPHPVGWQRCFQMQPVGPTVLYTPLAIEPILEPCK